MKFEEFIQLITDGDIQSLQQANIPSQQFLAHMNTRQPHPYPISILSWNGVGDTSRVICSPLHLACAHNHTSVIAWLIEKINQLVAQNLINLPKKTRILNAGDRADGCGRTPLFIAIRHGNLPAVQLFLNQPEVDVSISTFVGGIRRAPLEIANVEMANLLLQHNPAAINHTDNFGVTPLHIAIDEGYAEKARFLIEAGADINAQTNENCPWVHLKTPLRTAIYRGSIEIIDLLLERGVLIHNTELQMIVDSEFTALRGLKNLIIGARALAMQAPQLEARVRTAAKP